MKVIRIRRTRKVARAKRKNPRFGHHRPVLSYGKKRGKTGWFRSKKSKLFPRATRINPKRRKRSRSLAARLNPIRMFKNPFRKRRRNPISFPIQQTIKDALVITGGILLGMGSLKMMVTYGTRYAQYRKFFGAGNVVIGALIFGSAKSDYIKSFGITIAGIGIYDLIAINFPTLNLPTIATGSNNAHAMIAERNVPTSSIQSQGSRSYANQSSQSDANLSGSYRRGLQGSYRRGLQGNYQSMGSDSMIGDSDVEIG